MQQAETHKAAPIPHRAERLGLPFSVAKKTQKHVSSFSNLRDIITNLNAETLHRQTLLTENELATMLLNYLKNMVILSLTLN